MKRTYFVYDRDYESLRDFCGSSAGKESACNAGDPSSIPWSGRSPIERIGYPLQYSWASLVGQMLKNPPAMRETWVRSWVGKIPWRRAWQPTLVFLPGESHGQRSLVSTGLQSIGSVGHDKRVRMHAHKFI